MFDLIQIKGLLKNKNLKEDIKYIDGLTQLRVYEDNRNREYDLDEELNILKLLDHSHDDIELLSSITDSDIEKWNSKCAKSKINTSDYTNDVPYADIGYLNSILESSISEIDNLQSIYYEYEELIIDSLSGDKIVITVDDDGVINTEKYYN